MNNFIHPLLLPIFLVFSAGCSKSDKPALLYPVSQDTILYKESSEDFPNPDRGFYRVAETSADTYELLDAVQLRKWRTLQPAEGGDYSVYSSLIFRNIILTGFANQPLATSLLSAMEKDFTTARNAGMKIVLRFTYTITSNSGGCPEGFICPPYGDAPKEIVLAHIAQLKPVLQKNADVISCMQMGFVGTWGENYYSDYFGDPSSNGAGQLFDQNWIDRGTVISALLDALPPDRMIQVRTPQQKQRYVGGPGAALSMDGLNAGQAYNGTAAARIGFHNDCFISSPDDYGTFADYGNSSSSPSYAPGPLKDYFINDSKYVPVGGETCDDAYSPMNDCEPAGKVQAEMRSMHYSFLNCAYNNEVNNDWQSGGCMESIKRNLGYRFVLKQTVHPTAPATIGKNYSFSFNLDNPGYAAPFNSYPAKIILRNKQTETEYSFETGTNARVWYPGHTEVGITLLIPKDTPPGDYKVLMQLADPYPSLAGRSEYAIRLANEGLWEELTGYNDLLFDLKIKE